MLLLVSQLTEGIVVDGNILVSLLMAWLSLPAVESIANASLVGSAFVGNISVGFIVSQWLRNSYCENRVSHF